MKEFNIFEEILALQNEGVTAFSELLKFSGKGNPKTDIKEETMKNLFYTLFFIVSIFNLLSTHCQTPDSEHFP